MGLQDSAISSSREPASAYSPTVSRLSLLICRCAGVDIGVLRLAEYEDIGKYIAQGAFVLVTASLGFLTGSYALYLIFGSYALAVVFGIIWAIVIFTFDRMVLLTMRKDGSRWRQFLSALPRFLVAMVLAFILSTPIELKVFEEDITALISREREAAWKENLDHEKESRRLELTKTIDYTNAQLDRLQGEIKLLSAKKQAERKSQKDDENTHFSKYSPAGLKARTQGRISQSQKQIDQYGDSIEKAEESSINLRKKIEELTNQLSNLQFSQEAFEDTGTATFREKLAALVKMQAPGLAVNENNVARVKASGNEILEAKTTVVTGWAIRLLLFMLEISPVLLKLSGKSGRYDHLLAAVRESGRREVIKTLNVVRSFNDSLRRRIGGMIDKDKATPDAVIQLMSLQLGYRSGKVEPLYSEEMIKQVGKFLADVKMHANNQPEKSLIRQSLATLETFLKDPSRRDEALMELNELVQHVQSLVIPALHSKHEISEFLSELKQVLNKVEESFELNKA